MTPRQRQRIEAVLGRPVARATPLGGGSVGPAWRLDFAGDARRLVAKLDAAHGQLDLEGWMLRELARLSELPVPGVVHAAPDMLILDYVPSGGGIGAGAEIHAADLLAGLHGVTAPRYGLDRDTLIGALDQPNAPSRDWLSFFRDRRLLAMGRLARDRDGLPEGCFARLERLCGRLERFIAEPARPSLIHGDVWGGNVLVRDDRVAAFIDPAIHYADAELELAYTTMFHTFGPRFFDRYGEHRPIDPAFFEVRREVYLLYPILVHAALFGASYGASADWILRRLVG